jgi:hypothetical protein
MVGIVSKSTKASIRIYKLQKHYSEWEFVYDPLEDMLSSVSLIGGGGGNVSNAGNSSTGTGTTGTGIGGSGIGGSGIGGSSGGFGSGSGFGSSPTTPQQPQQ